MSEISSVDEFWEQYEAFIDWAQGEAWKVLGVTEAVMVNLPAGVTEVQLSEAEQVFGFPFPKELRQLYRRHDGASFWPGAEYLSDLHTTLNNAQMRRRIAGGQKEGQVWWATNWLPIAEDGGGGVGARPFPARGGGAVGHAAGGRHPQAGPDHRRGAQPRPQGAGRRS